MTHFRLEFDFEKYKFFQQKSLSCVVEYKLWNLYYIFVFHKQNSFCLQSRGKWHCLFGTFTEKNENEELEATGTAIYVIQCSRTGKLKYNVE